MPHIRVEYSANMELALNVPALCAGLRDAAVATGVFERPGVRVRAFAADHVVVADGDPGHGFVDITVRIGTGRDEATRQRVGEALFAAARKHTDAYMSAAPFLLSLDLQEAGAVSFKTSSIRAHLPG